MTCPRSQRSVLGAGAHPNHPFPLWPSLGGHGHCTHTTVGNWDSEREFGLFLVSQQPGFLIPLLVIWPLPDWFGADDVATQLWSGEGRSSGLALSLPWCVTSGESLRLIAVLSGLLLGTLSCKVSPVPLKVMRTLEPRLQQHQDPDLTRPLSFLLVLFRFLTRK